MLAGITVFTIVVIFLLLRDEEPRSCKLGHHWTKWFKGPNSKIRRCLKCSKREQR